VNRDRFTWHDGDLKITETTIDGEPALFLTPREKSWRGLVSAAGLKTGNHLALAFRVLSFRRAGNPFDIDNLAKPVLDELAARPETIWVRVTESHPAWLTISAEVAPAAPETALSVSVASPRARSAKPVVEMPELQGLSLIGLGTEPLGLEIRFDSPDVPIWNFGFDGPIKPFIDGMGPLLGPARQGPADYRIKDLRLSRGARPDRRGAQIRMWLLD